MQVKIKELKEQHLQDVKRQKHEFVENLKSRQFKRLEDTFNMLDDAYIIRTIITQHKYSQVLVNVIYPQREEKWHVLDFDMLYLWRQRIDNMMCEHNIEDTLYYSISRYAETIVVGLSVIEDFEPTSTIRPGYEYRNFGSITLDEV